MTIPPSDGGRLGTRADFQLNTTGESLWTGFVQSRPETDNVLGYKLEGGEFADYTVVSVKTFYVEPVYDMTGYPDPPTTPGPPECLEHYEVIVKVGL